MGGECVCVGRCVWGASMGWYVCVLFVKGVVCVLVSSCAVCLCVVLYVCGHVLCVHVHVVMLSV